jgi:hypothetical protein
VPFRNSSTTFCILVWDQANNIGKTGDAANLTLRGVGDGTEFTPAAPNITEVDSTNLKGVYKVTFAAGENNYAMVLCGGISSTANVVIQPVSWTNEMNANLAQILGTALTETAGYLAAGFKKFFNVATPVMTAESINQTGDSYARLGAPAGASTAADIAEVEGETAAIKAVTDSLVSAYAWRRSV